MRRSAPNFKVEVRRSARRTHRVTTLDNDMIDPPSPDDVPERDLHTEDESFDEQMRSAEAALFGYEHRPTRIPAKLARERGGYIPPQPKQEESIPQETSSIVSPAENGRVLQSTTYVDPLEERIREEAEKLAAEIADRTDRRRTNPSKSQAVRPDSTVTPRDLTRETPRAWPDDEAIRDRQMRGIARPSPSAEDDNQPRSISPSYPRTTDELIETIQRVDQRILYNAWTYRVVKVSARNESRAVRASLLKPGERWKRRLPVYAW